MGLRHSESAEGSFIVIPVPNFPRFEVNAEAASAISGDLDEVRMLPVFGARNVSVFWGDILRNLLIHHRITNDFFER